MLMSPDETAPENESERSLEQSINLVYAAAMRQLNGDANQAADVTQAVMLILLTKSKAGQLPREQFMSGWLLRVTRYCVLQVRRSEARRARHEAEAVTQSRPTSTENSDRELQAGLDDALLMLPALDREVLTRRYLQNQSLAAIAAAVGRSENTAGRRIARAVEKLRRILCQRGVNVPATGLIAAMGFESAIKAPPACAAVNAPSSNATQLANRVLWKLTMLQSAMPGFVLVAALLVLTSVIWLTVNTNTASTTAPLAAVAAEPQPAPVTIEVDSVIGVPSDALLKELLDGLRDNQTKFRSIHIVGMALAAEYDAGHKVWMAPAHTIGQAWGEAGEQRRVRTQVTHGEFRTLGPDGMGPIEADSFTEAWNGKTLFRQLGPPDSSPAGETFVTRYLKGDELLGGDFSMQLAWDRETSGDASGNHITFDRNPLGPATLGHMKLTARRVKLEGSVEAMELTVQMPDDGIARKEVFWFDRNRGYGLLGRLDTITKNGNELWRITRRVDQLTQAAPGVFYPTKAEMYWQKGGVPVEWTALTTTSAVANEPISQALFKIDFPAGIPITDFDVHGRGIRHEAN